MRMETLAQAGQATINFDFADLATRRGAARLTAGRRLKVQRCHFGRDAPPKLR
jgi:hypothetical protein